MLHPNKIISAM